jgi:hypothetical protein
MSTKIVQSIKEELLSEGYIAIYFCEFESRDNEDVEHYQLLKSGDKIEAGCADLGRIPIISEEATSILQDYIDDKPIVIHSDLGLLSK